MTSTCPCYTVDNTRVGFAREYGDKKCGVKLMTPLDVSAVVSGITTLGITTDEVTIEGDIANNDNTRAAVYKLFELFLSDVKGMKASAYNGKKTALSWLYGAQMVVESGFLTVNSSGGTNVAEALPIVAELNSFFHVLRCYVIENKDLSYENSQYLVNLAKTWYTTVVALRNDQNSTAEEIIVTFRLRLLGPSNEHFKCIHNKFV